MATTLHEPPVSPPPSPESLIAGSPLPEVRRVSVSTTDDHVTLTGTVSTYYLKQLAQETVRSGVRNRRLVNRLVVSSR